MKNLGISLICIGTTISCIGMILMMTKKHPEPKVESSYHYVLTDSTGNQDSVSVFYGVYCDSLLISKEGFKMEKVNRKGVKVNHL